MFRAYVPINASSGRVSLKIPAPLILPAKVPVRNAGLLVVVPTAAYPTDDRFAVSAPAAYFALAASAPAAYFALAASTTAS